MHASGVVVVLGACKSSFRLAVGGEEGKHHQTYVGHTVVGNLTADERGDTDYVLVG